MNYAMLLLTAMCFVVLVVMFVGYIKYGEKICFVFIAPATIATMYAIAYTIKIWS